MQLSRKVAPLLELTLLASLGLTAAQAGTIDFENVPQIYHTASEAGGGQNLGGYYQGVTFTGGVTIYSNDAAVNPINSNYPPHSGHSEIGVSHGNAFDILFSAPSTNTSFYYTTLGSSVVTGYLSGGGTQQYNLSDNYGSNSLLSLTGSLTRINITFPTSSFTLDDLTGSSFTGAPAVTAVPEPSSVAAFAFIGLGVAGLMLKARKRTSVA